MSTPGLRICVVGAGPAGLSAAWHLRQQGHTSVTVLERNMRVGGKCHTVHGDGLPYELGAIDTLLGYTDVFELARTVGAELVANQVAGAYDPRTGRIISIVKAVFRRRSPFVVLAATVRYFYEIWKARKVLRPGFAGLDPDLSKPFQHWLEENRLTAIKTAFILPVVACGYGRYSEIPAAYVLKYMGIWNFLSCILGGLFGSWPKQFRRGFQDLWEKVAAQLGDVRLGVNITRIKRGATITVECDREGRMETLEFDRLILACPLDLQSLGFLDMRAEERELFQHIRYDKYYASLCRCTGIPGGVFLAESPVPAIGHPWGIIKEWRDSNLCVFYSPASAETTPEDILKYIRDDVQKKLGGTVELCQQVEWDYFPHVSTAVFADGFYDRLEALQGHTGTFYAGGLLNFETVCTVVSYSKALVREHFPPAPGPAGKR